MNQFLGAQAVVPDNPFPVTGEEMRREDDGCPVDGVKEGTVEPLRPRVDAVGVDGRILPETALESRKADVKHVPAILGLDSVPAHDRVAAGLEHHGAEEFHLVLYGGLVVLAVLQEFGMDLRKGHRGYYHISSIFSTPHKLQIQVVNERTDLLVNLRREVLCHGRKGGIGPGIGRAVPADEPVGNVDVVGPILLGTVLLEEVGHFDARLREFGGYKIEQRSLSMRDM